LRASLAFAGLTALALAWAAWRQPVIRNTRALPTVHEPPVDAVSPATPGAA
jgi:hypothetical protein